MQVGFNRAEVDTVVDAKQDRGFQRLAGMNQTVDVTEHVEATAMSADVQEFPPGTVQRGEERRGTPSHRDTEDLSVDAIDRVYVRVVDDSIEELDERGTTVVGGRNVSFPGA